MGSEGIYANDEEPDPPGLKDKTSRRAGGFLSQRCRCCSEGISISVLYIANVVLFLLWIITICIISAKYFQIAKEVEQLHKNQTQFHANVTKELPDLQTGKGKIWDEMYKIENALHSLNALGCKLCPEGWLLNRGKCYYFREQNMNWSLARKFCENQGGHLVVINDADEQTFLQTNKKFPNNWIGLHDMEIENNFVWVDGSRLSYTNWGPEQPDDYGHVEDCVEMRDDDWWNDLSCNTPLEGSICEKTWNCQ